jgi:hypothetical protein
MEAMLRVGQTVQDLCRPCKMVRKHTVIAAGGDVVRVICDFCGSQHNYRRGGPEPRAVAPRTASAGHPPATRPAAPVAVACPSERSQHVTNEGRSDDLEALLRRIVREEAGWTPLAPAARWIDGELVLRPGRSGVQEKSWPIDAFFAKIVMVRNRLRTLEQQVNASELSNDAKLKLQAYVTACYGSLTSFNVLFADEEDRFRGTGG